MNVFKSTINFITRSNVHLPLLELEVNKSKYICLYNIYSELEIKFMRIKSDVVRNLLTDYCY